MRSSSAGKDSSISGSNVLPSSSSARARRSSNMEVIAQLPLPTLSSDGEATGLPLPVPCIYRHAHIAGGDAHSRLTLSQVRTGSCGCCAGSPAGMALGAGRSRISMVAAAPHLAAPLRMRHALRTHGGADEFRTCGHHLLYGSGARAVYWYIPQRVTHVSPPGHWAGTVI